MLINARKRTQRWNKSLQHVWIKVCQMASISALMKGLNKYWENDMKVIWLWHVAITKLVMWDAGRYTSIMEVRSHTSISLENVRKMSSVPSVIAQNEMYDHNCICISKVTLQTQIILQHFYKLLIWLWHFSILYRL